MDTANVFESGTPFGLRGVTPVGWSRSSEWSHGYIAGYEHGRKDEYREGEVRIAAVFESDQERAERAAATIANRLDEELGVRCNRIALRALEFGVFEALLFVPVSDYLSDDFSKAYRIGREERSKVDGDGFRFQFSFSPYEEGSEFNASALVADEFHRVLVRREVEEEGRA